MKTHTLWIVAVALCVSACSRQEPAQPGQAEADSPVEDAAAPAWEVDGSFVRHMHWHAEKLDTLMFALADGDLDGAMTPAYWLSRHDTVEGMPEELQIHLVGMREAALAVEAANDLETARAAAEELSNRCQGCHNAAGVNSPE